MWHYLNNNNAAEGPVDEARIAELIGGGAIAAKTLVWTDGMAEWMPADTTALAGLFRPLPPPVPPPSPAEAAHAKNLKPYRSLHRLVWWITTLLVLTVLVNLVALWSEVSTIELLGRIHRKAQFTMAEAKASDARARWIGLEQVGVYLVTVGFFWRWILLAAHNVRALGARGLEISPGWAVGYYFVPVANLWKPYQAMVEIWKATASPWTWQQEPGSALLGWWWTFWILTNLAGQLVFRSTMNPEFFGGYDGTVALSIISDTVDLPLCILAMLLVRKISQRQAALAAAQ